MENNKTIPKIRFTGFTDAWEQRKLGNLTQIKTGSSDLQDSVEDGQYPFFVRSENIERSNRYIFDGEAILIPGEGRLGDIYHYINGKFDFHQRVYKISGFEDSNTDGKYILYYMQKNFKQHAMRFTVKATVDSLRLPMLTDFDVVVPKIEEQRKISNLFANLDSLITLHQRECDLLVKTKKSYLQKMFPKNGEDKPEIRFAGFTDAWEQRKLGEVTKSYSGVTPSVGKMEYYNGQIPFIRSAEINNNTTELFLSETGLTNSSAKMVRVGDILYALYGATSGEVGIAQIQGAINQAILAIKPDDGYDSQFLMYWLRGQKQRIIDKYLQGGQGNLSGSLVKDLLVMIPNYDEQERIGAYFQQLDHLITLHQRKVEKLKIVKKSMLEKMFV